MAADSSAPKPVREAAREGMQREKRQREGWWTQREELASLFIGSHEYCMRRSQRAGEVRSLVNKEGKKEANARSETVRGGGRGNVSFFAFRLHVERMEAAPNHSLCEIRMDVVRDIFRSRVARSYILSFVYETDRPSALPRVAL